MKEKHVIKIGWFASIMALVMFFSYIDQITMNLDGNKGSTILPLATMTNCAAWTAYGSLRTKKDWPIIICNIPGVVLGLVTFITSF